MQFPLLQLPLSGFNFTGPPTSTPLSLSAPVNITWDAHPSYSTLELSWGGPTTAPGESFSYVIAESLDPSDGVFTWDPADVSAALQSTEIPLQDTSSYWFKAEAYGTLSPRGDGFTSDKYKLTDYPFIGPAEDASRPPYPGYPGEVLPSFEFTGPSTSTPLSLSDPVNITWEANTKYTELDLTWGGHTIHGTGFSYTIAEGLDPKDEVFTWEPLRVSEALQSTHIVLRDTNDYVFRASMHNKDSFSGETLQSDKYRITDYPVGGNEDSVLEL